MVQECDSVRSTCNPTLRAPKLTTTLTVPETSVPVSVHVAFLRRMLTNPLEHGDVSVQQDSSVEILEVLFDACSAEPQSPPNAWLGRSTVLSLWNLTIEVNAW